MDKYPNRDAFEQVCKDLEDGIPLNFRMVGHVFGQEFWEVLMLYLTDAKDARVIFDMILQENKLVK